MLTLKQQQTIHFLYKAIQNFVKCHRTYCHNFFLCQMSVSWSKEKIMGTTENSLRVCLKL